MISNRPKNDKYNKLGHLCNSNSQNCFDSFHCMYYLDENQHYYSTLLDSERTIA